MRITWAMLCKLEPRLVALAEEITAITDDGTARAFCANAIWYGYNSPTHDNYKERVSKLVGWDRHPHVILSSSEAYDVAYKHLYDLLPECRNCHCIIPDADMDPLPKPVKTGVVYVIHDGNGRYKIGMSTDIDARLRSLQTAMSGELHVETVIVDDHPYRLERRLHSEFATKCLRGEWFALTAEDVAIIKARQGQVT